MNKAYLVLALLTATSFLAASDASRKSEQRHPLIDREPLDESQSTHTPPASPPRLTGSSAIPIGLASPQSTPPASPTRLADLTDSSAPTSLAMLESKPQTPYSCYECSYFAPACGTYCSDCSVSDLTFWTAITGSCSIASGTGAVIAALHGCPGLATALIFSGGIGGGSCLGPIMERRERGGPPARPFIRQRLQEGQSPCSPVCERYIMTLWPTEPTSELE